MSQVLEKMWLPPRAADSLPKRERERRGRERERERERERQRERESRAPSKK
jgi:hypothetical protein